MNERRFDSIVRQHAAHVRTKLRYCGVDAADVDDLTQNTFVIAWERRDELPRNRSKQKKWLAGVAFRLAQNWRRSNWRLVELVDPLKLDKMLAPSGASVETLAIVAARVESLPRPYRDVARLRLRGLSFTDIASKLGMSRSMAFTHWQKAQAELQEGER